MKRLPKNIKIYLSLFVVIAFLSNCRTQPEIKPDSLKKSSAVVFQFLYNYENLLMDILSSTVFGL